MDQSPKFDLFKVKLSKFKVRNSQPLTMAVFHISHNKYQIKRKIVTTKSAYGLQLLGLQAEARSI